MTNQEAIKVLEANYPTPNYSELREAVDMALALLREQTQVVRCTECKYWYRDSGLTARRCEKHGIITKQFDFCSYGEVVRDA